MRHNNEPSHSTKKKDSRSLFVLMNIEVLVFSICFAVAKRMSTIVSRDLYETTPSSRFLTINETISVVCFVLHAIMSHVSKSCTTRMRTMQSVSALFLILSLFFVLCMFLPICVTLS